MVEISRYSVTRLCDPDTVRLYGGVRETRLSRTVSRMHKLSKARRAACTARLRPLMQRALAVFMRVQALLTLLHAPQEIMIRVGVNGRVRPSGFRSVSSHPVPRDTADRAPLFEGPAPRRRKIPGTTVSGIATEVYRQRAEARENARLNWCRMMRISPASRRRAVDHRPEPDPHPEPKPQPEPQSDHIPQVPACAGADAAGEDNPDTDTLRIWPPVPIGPAGPVDIRVEIEAEPGNHPPDTDGDIPAHRCRVLYLRESTDRPDADNQDTLTPGHPARVDRWPEE